MVDQEPGSMALMEPKGVFIIGGGPGRQERQNNLKIEKESGMPYIFPHLK